MHKELEGLEPEILWNYFERIRQIPRCSKHEEKASEFVQSVAKELGLEFKKDDLGNVVIIKPASPGYEDHSGVCIQGHLDMVCEKNADVQFDFSKDPIDLQRDGNYLKAVGTTLGADNGIGVAAALAIAELKDLKHPPLELLFTVEEETGLVGASNLLPDFLTSKRLINADSEELGTIYIGCAGGGDTVLKLPMGSRIQPEGLTGLEVEVKGLKGGHSGVDIHLGRANAIKCLTRVLWNISQEQKPMIVDISGGNKRNAIPREAKAVLFLKDVNKASEVMKRMQLELKDEFEGIEEKIEIKHENFEGNEAFPEESSMKLISLLQGLPHGYLSFNPNIPGLVDTSTNLATVTLEDNEAVIGTSSRSSMNSAMESVRDVLIATGDLAGAIGEKGHSYPSWKPNMNSELLGMAKRVYKDKFGKEPEVKAIHAGLETAIIGQRFSGMDMTSIGPQIEFPHSPDERVEISSVKTFWEYLIALLENL